MTEEHTGSHREGYVSLRADPCLMQMGSSVGVGEGRSGVHENPRPVEVLLFDRSGSTS